MNMSKLKFGVEETKTAQPCCRGPIITHFEQALGEQQITEIFTILLGSIPQVFNINYCLIVPIDRVP